MSYVQRISNFVIILSLLRIHILQVRIVCVCLFACLFVCLRLCMCLCLCGLMYLHVCMYHKALVSQFITYFLIILSLLHALQVCVVCVCGGYLCVSVWVAVLTCINAA